MKKRKIKRPSRINNPMSNSLERNIAKSKYLSGISGIDENYLRFIAQEGSKNVFWKTVAESLTGSKSLGNIVGKMFDKQYTTEQIKEAKDILKQYDIERKSTKVIKNGDKTTNAVKNVVVNIAKSVGMLSKQIKKNHQEIIKAVEKGFEEKINLKEKSALKIKSNVDYASNNIKPEIFESYLAEQGLYIEKSTGRFKDIESKKYAKAPTDEKIREYAKRKEVDPLEGTSANLILGKMEEMLENDSLIRKKEFEELMKNVKVESPLASSSAFNIESDEQKIILEKALTDALETIIKKHPELFQCSGEGGGIIPFPRNQKAVERAGEKAAEKGGVKAAEKAAEKGGTKVAGKIGAKVLAKKIPLIGALFGAGFAVSRLMEGDTTGAGLELASGITGAIPGFGTAASLGIDATIAARDFGAFEGTPQTPTGNQPTNLQPTKSNAPNSKIITPDWERLGYPEFKGISMMKDATGKWVSEDYKLKATNPNLIKALDLQASGMNTPNTIIEGNRNIEQSRSTNYQPQQQQSPAPIVNNYVASPPPIPAVKEDTKIEVHNNENTFNRLLAQDFNHPSTYSSLTMG